jgi:transcriptional regulator with GAF, ATPase, and Fis domain
LESELFGHEAGSFTGATQTRQGLFEIASKGTLFLDELAEMPPQLQVKLLRALQEQEIKRVGGSKNIKVTPRIIAATNKDIEKSLANGSLREDLYYRVAVVTLDIPPLRERPEDILPLAERCRDLFCSKLGRSKLSLSPDAERLLREYQWPGNVRELENVIERAVILAENQIRPEHLGITPQINLDSLNDAALSLQKIAAEAAKNAEVDVITRVLTQTGGNKARAAKILGVSYKTLLSKVREYGLGEAGPDEPVEQSLH